MREANAAIDLTKSDFEWFCATIAREAGIFIPEAKHKFVYNRLMRRIPELGLSSCAAYREYLESPAGREGGELERLLEEMVTHETAFFRYRPHFDLLGSQIFGMLADGRERRGQRINVLSVGCSSGEEAYSIAIVASEMLSMEDRQVVKIRGLDISRSVLRRARAALYTSEDIEAVPRPLLDEYFVREEGGYRVVSRISGMVEFQRFNIHTGDWQRNRGADLIFCRNTVIYFTPEARDRAVANMVECLRPGGVIVFGHTEIVDGFAFGLRRIASTAYRKETA